MFKNGTQHSLKLNMELNKFLQRRPMLIIELAFLILGVILGLIFFIDSVSLAIVTWVTFLIIIIIYPLFCNIMLKVRLKSLMKKNPLQDGNNIVHFVFGNEAVSVTVTRFERQISNSIVYYMDMPKIFEYKENLYIFTGYRQILILSKAGMEEGGFDDLKIFLKDRMTAQKYKIKKF